MKGPSQTGTEFTCFTGTRVQVLTLRQLARRATSAEIDFIAGCVQEGLGTSNMRLCDHQYNRCVCVYEGVCVSHIYMSGKICII